MIKKLTFRLNVDKYGNCYGTIPPTKYEIIDKINELIDNTNKQQTSKMKFSQSFMTKNKFRIVETHYHYRGEELVDYEVQKRFLGFLWWYNFQNIDDETTGIYDTLEEAKQAIDDYRQIPHKTIIKL